MPYTYLSLKTDLDDVTAAAAMDLTNRSNSCAVAVGNLISSGARRRYLKVTQGNVDASGTVTFASTGPTNGQTMTLGISTITAATSATPGALEFTRSNTPAVNATNLAALINSHEDFDGVCTAEADGAVVTITARAGSGALGNTIVLANVNLSNTTMSGSGELADGDNGTTTDVALGLAE